MEKENDKEKFVSFCETAGKNITLIKVKIKKTKP